MPTFQVHAIDQGGIRASRRIWSDNVASVYAKLEQYGLLAVEVKACRAPTEREKARLTARAEPLKGFLDQLVMQMDAGMAIDRALEHLLQNEADRSIRILCEGLVEAISANGEVAGAFQAFPRIFPTHLCRMIEVGHRTGKLTETIAEVARAVEDGEKIKAEARRALHYPVIAALISVMVAVFLLGFVMPMFGRVFADLGIKPPTLTSLYLGIGNGLSKHWGIFLTAITGVLFVARVVFSVRRVRAVFDYLLTRVPLISGINEALAVTRIVGAMRQMEKVGFAAQQGLAAAGGLSGNRVYDEAVGEAVRRVEKGEGIGEALMSTKRFPALMCSTIRIGEESNRMGTGLQKVHEYYSRLSSQRIAGALQWIEPVVTVVLALFVGSVAVSLFYPLVTLAMGIKH